MPASFRPSLYSLPGGKNQDRRQSGSASAKLRQTSLPGAIGMYALSLGVQRIHDVLPPIAYAFLSGLNASTVGIVALAAVQVRISGA